MKEEICIFLFFLWRIRRKYVFLHLNKIEKGMIEQLNKFFAVIVSSADVDSESALVRTGITVLRHQPDIKAI